MIANSRCMIGFHLLPCSFLICICYVIHLKFYVRIQLWSASYLLIYTDAKSIDLHRCEILWILYCALLKCVNCIGNVCKQLMQYWKAYSQIYGFKF